MKYIIANWKSNKTVAQTLEWIEDVGPKIEKKEVVEVIVCPPFTNLEALKKAVMVGNFALKVGAQNISPFAEGSYTGEVAATLVKDLAEYVIIGHSERRKEFNETDEQVATKVAKANEAGLTPIVCVQGAETPIPEGVKVVAYEPIFAIGTGNPDTPQNANEVIGTIKQTHPDAAVLYGGSVTSENAKAFLEQEHIDGLLIGKASLDSTEFVKITELA